VCEYFFLDSVICQFYCELSTIVFLCSRKLKQEQTLEMQQFADQDNAAVHQTLTAALKYK